MKKTIRTLLVILMALCVMCAVLTSCNKTDPPPATKTGAIAFELDGGTLDNAPAEYTVGEGLDLEKLVPTKSGYVFFAWYFDEEFDERAEFDEDTEGDKTLYARWMPAPTKRGEIADVTKVYFGDGTSYTVDLTKYVNAKGNKMTYVPTSSNTSVATVEAGEDSVTVNIVAPTGEAKITIDAYVKETKCTSFEFDITSVNYTKVACIGDSLTAVRTVNSVEYVPYPSALKDILGNDYTVFNAGRSGYGVTPHGKYGNFTSLVTGNEDGTQHEDCLAFAPEVLIIMLGTNDAKGWDSDFNGGVGCAKDTFKDDYKELVNIYKTAFPDIKIYLVSSPTVRPDNSLAIPKDKIDGDIHTMQLELAEELGLPIFDLHPLLNPTNSLYFLEDGVHFTDEGAEYVAELIYNFIKTH